MTKGYSAGGDTYATIITSLVRLFHKSHPSVQTGTSVSLLAPRVPAGPSGRSATTTLSLLLSLVTLLQWRAHLRTHCHTQRALCTMGEQDLQSNLVLRLLPAAEEPGNV